MIDKMGRDEMQYRIALIDITEMEMMKNRCALYEQVKWENR